MSLPVSNEKTTSHPPAPEGLDTSQRFTASVSHEIRTPLNGILGMVSLLEETDLSPVQKEYVEAIGKSGSRLLDLLNNVLDYSRLEAGEIPLDIAPFDTAELIQDVVELLAPRAHAANLDIAAAAMPGLPTKFIGDAGRIRQILFNLAGNAIKFTQTGGILVTARQDKTGELVFAVRDTGAGIPKSEQEKIFSAYGQVSASDAGRDSGVGLGLAIAQRLAKAMKGRLHISSEVGQGAGFFLTLPLEIEQAPKTSDNSQKASKSLNVDLQASCASQIAVMSALANSNLKCSVVSGRKKADVAIIDASLSPTKIKKLTKKSPTLVVLRPEDRAQIPAFREMGCVGYLIRPLRGSSIAKRVEIAARGEEIKETQESKNTAPKGARALIADDNPVNSLLAKRALVTAGFAVDTVGTGAEAIEAASNTPYSIVFMDVRMPVMDGLEATRRIRALDGDVPVIAVTADVDPDLEAKADRAGVSLVAAKPIDPQRLRDLALSWAVSERKEN